MDDGLGPLFHEFDPSNPLNSLFSKMGLGPKVTVEQEVDIKDGPASELLTQIRAKKLEIIEIINKAKRLKKEIDLLSDDIWDHSASLFGYQSQAALQQDQKFMTLDDAEGTVTLKGVEMPKEKPKE